MDKDEKKPAENTRSEDREPAVIKPADSAETPEKNTPEAGSPNPQPAGPVQPGTQPPVAIPMYQAEKEPEPSEKQGSVADTPAADADFRPGLEPQSGYVTLARKPAPPAVNASGHPGLVTTMMPQKRNNVIAMTVTGLLIVLMICGTLIYMARSGSGIHTSDTIRYKEQSDYLVLSGEQVMSEPFSTSANGKVQPGQIVYIVESLRNPDGEIWGMIADDQWVRLADSRYTYLIDNVLVDYTSEKEEKDYIAQKDTYVFTIPQAISEPISSIKKGDTVYVLETAEMEDGTWGRIGVNQWVILNKNGTDVLTVVEEKSDDADQDEEDEEKNDDSDIKKDSDDDEEGSKEIDGFKTGVYELNYDMVIRRSPSFDGEEVKVLDKGTLVRVAWLRRMDERDSIWAELDSKGSGYWMCLKAGSNQYLSWHDPDDDQEAVSVPDAPDSSQNSSSNQPPTDSNTPDVVIPDTRPIQPDSSDSDDSSSSNSGNPDSSGPDVPAIDDDTSAPKFPLPQVD